MNKYDKEKYILLYLLMSIGLINASFPFDTQPIFELTDKYSPPDTIGFTPDGENIVFAGEINNSLAVVIWNINTRKLTKKIDLPNSPQFFSISKDGSQILIGYYSFYEWAELYDIDSAELIMRFGPHGIDPPFSPRTAPPMTVFVSLSPNKKWAVTKGDQEACITHIWDAETGEEKHTIPNCSIDMVFVDDKRIFIGDSLYDVETGELLKEIPVECDYIPYLKLSLDKSKLIIPRCGPLAIWDWRSGIKVKELPITTSGVFLSPDNKYLAAWNNNGINIWDVENEIIINSLDPKFGSAILSPNWKYLLTVEQPKPFSDYMSDYYYTFLIWRVEDLFQVTSVENFENY